MMKTFSKFPRQFTTSKDLHLNLGTCTGDTCLVVFHFFVVVVVVYLSLEYV